MSLPGMSRDAVVHATACDASVERNCLLVKGHSVDQWGGIELPRAPNSFLSKRMVIHAFNSAFEFVGPSSVKTSMVICIDPKTPLPKNIANYLNACCISVDPHALHRNFVLQDAEFYKDWIIPRIKVIYALRDWHYQSPAWLLDDDQEDEDVYYNDEAKGGPPPPEESSSTALGSIQEPGDGIRCEGLARSFAHTVVRWWCLHYFYTTTHTIYLLACAFPPNYSTTTRGK
eukprot:514523_1